MSAHALLKVATKSYFRGKNSENLSFWVYFSEVKTEEYDWSKLCFIRNFKKRSYLVQIHTFWKLVHVLFVHNILVAIGGSEREVNWRNRIIRAPREDIILKL